MELSKLILPPDVSHLRLIGPLLVFVEFAFLAFTGTALVSTVLSLAHRKAQPALARHFADVVSGHISVWVTLGLLPLATLTILLGQLTQGSRYAILDALLKLAPIIVAAMGALWLYRQRLNPLFGAAGVLALLAFIFPFVNLLELMNRPELWPLVDALLPDMYRVEGLIRVLTFLVGGLLTTGAALLFVYFVWQEHRLPADAPHRTELRWWALILTFLGAMALPALVVWHLGVLPVGALSVVTIKTGIPVLVALWLVALIVLAMMLNGHEHGVATVTVLAFAGLLFEVTRVNAVQMTAISDRVALIERTSETRFESWKQTQEARYVSNIPLDPAAGAKIYQERCSTCHAFDQKVVGPAHKNVLPKYEGKPDALVAFILNPTKVDPAFPAMMPLGLSRREAQAVADYLLKRYETEVKGGAK
jgi:cytochrome c551/c552